jgi:hypothetical protein
MDTLATRGAIRRVGFGFGSDGLNQFDLLEEIGSS